MASCKDCIHEKLCVIKAFPDAFENTQWGKKPCDHFKPKTEWIRVEYGRMKEMTRSIVNEQLTADVAPKSEVDKWYHEYHAIKDELKQEKMYHRETEKLADKYFNELQTAKSEFARKIFEEIEKLTFVSGFGGDVPNLVIMTEKDYAELKKKSTGEQT